MRYGSDVWQRSDREASVCAQVLLNLAASATSSHAVRNAGIAMVLQSLIHSVTQARPRPRTSPLRKNIGLVRERWHIVW
jgi:hypothetical protein